jgi:hypothetical protein
VRRGLEVALACVVVGLGSALLCLAVASVLLSLDARELDETDDIPSGLATHAAACLR